MDSAARCPPEAGTRRRALPGYAEDVGRRLEAPGFSTEVPVTADAARRGRAVELLRAWPRRTTRPRPARRLQELRDQALHAGSERAVTRQRERGKLLARERLEKLLDPGSFVELDRFVRHREVEFGMREQRPYGDAVVTGYGTILGRKTFVFSQDFTVFGGSLSEVFAEKVCKVMDLALAHGCPVVGINDSGARASRKASSLLPGTRRSSGATSGFGVVPQISLVMGPCAGGAVYSPAITDFVLMVEGSSYMFITGPDVVKTVTGEDVSFEELGGAATHAARSGSRTSPRRTRRPAWRTRGTCCRSCRRTTSKRRPGQHRPIPSIARTPPSTRSCPTAPTSPTT